MSTNYRPSEDILKHYENPDYTDTRHLPSDIPDHELAANGDPDTESRPTLEIELHTSHDPKNPRSIIHTVALHAIKLVSFELEQALQPLLDHRPEITDTLTGLDIETESGNFSLKITVEEVP